MTFPIYDRIYNYLQELDLLYELQFGFRPKYSTYMALIASVEIIISALDKGDPSLLFADDTNSFLTGRNLDAIIEIINTELRELLCVG